MPEPRPASHQIPISTGASGARERKSVAVERGIRRLPNGHYEVRVHVGRDPLTGRLRQVSRVVDGGIRAARAKRAELLTERDQGTHGGTESTLGYLLDAWNTLREQNGRSPTTLHEDRRKIDTVIRPALGHKRLSKLSTVDVDGFYGAQRAAGASPAMVAHYHAILRAALRQGQRWGWIRENPVANATVPTVPKPDLPVPTSDEVRRLIEVAAGGRNPELAGVITVAALTGMRAGELCALRFSDVCARTVTVRSSAWVRGPAHGIKDPKSHQRRTIPGVHKLAVEVLDRRRRMVREAAVAAQVEVADAYVWSTDPLGTTPLSPRSLSQAFWHIARKAGVEARFHDLRHFAGTEMGAAGFGPRTIADLLGHADPAFTMRVYTKSRVERQGAALEALGRALTPKAIEGSTAAVVTS